MNTQITTELRPEIVVINGKAKTNSLKVSQHFNKQHKSVLRAIQNLDCSFEFTERNFALSEYKDDSGKLNPFYEITRDGFSFLAMGFIGKEAAKWKEAYINAFNEMESALSKQLSQNHTNIPAENDLAISISIKNLTKLLSYTKIPHPLAKDIKDELQKLTAEYIKLYKLKPENSGYFVFDPRNPVGVNTLVYSHIPHQLLQPLINAASSRLNSINAASLTQGNR